MVHEAGEQNRTSDVAYGASTAHGSSVREGLDGKDAMGKGLLRCALFILDMLNFLALVRL